MATAGKTADSRERPAIYEERPVAELWCDGRAHEQQIHTKNFLQKKFLAVRLRGSSKFRQLNMPGVAQSDRARIMRADKFADSKFLLDL